MSSKNASSDANDAASVTSGISASAGGLSATEKAQRKAERQKRIEAQMRAMEEAMVASRSAMEVMKSDFNDDGGGSVSSLGSGQTESTRGGGVRDEEAPGPLPTSSRGTSQRPGSTTDKFMESKTWGMDSAAVDMAAPRLSGATESARKFLWNDDEEDAEETGATGAAVRGLEKGGIFSPSSRNLSSVGAASSASKQEAAVDLTIDQVFGSGEAISSTGTPAASSRGHLLSRLRLGALAWGEGTGTGGAGHDSMKSVNLAPRGSGSDNLRDIQAADTDYDNEKGHGRRISARIGTSAAIAGTATKDWCVDHRRLVGLVTASAMIIGSVLLVGQNGGSGPAESSRGIGFPSLPSFGFSKGGDRLKAIKTAIINAEISYAEDFEDSDSPQSRSLDWLANHDEAELETIDPFILQRYSLMVLWFGTGYTPVESRKKNKKSEQGTDQEEEVVVLEEVWKNSDGWATSRGICSWYGVTCHHRPGFPLTETTYNDNNGVTTLRLPKNNLQGPLPREVFTGLDDLVVLELQENALTGKIYTDIGNLKKMEYFKLESNFLEGEIPTEIGMLQELEHIQLGYNNLIGSIPESIGDLAELRALGLHHNSLTSTIPSSIGKSVNLFEVYLDSNSLTGQIPPTIAALTELTDLRLRRNQLSGPLPSELGNMKSLTVLYVDANQISGTSECDRKSSYTVSQFTAFA